MKPTSLHPDMHSSVPLKTIILAEDDKDDVDIFHEVLKDINANVKLTLAEDGAQLMDILAELKVLPDLIFLDINMPRKTGIECLREIKSSPIWRDIKVIMLSTSNDMDLINNTYRQGANLYIPKCDDYSEFCDKITNCLLHNGEVIHVE